MKIERLLTEAFRYYTDSEIGAKLSGDQVMANNWRRGLHKPSYKSTVKLRKFHIDLVRKTLAKKALDDIDRTFLFESLTEFQQEATEAQVLCHEILVSLIKSSGSP